MPLINVALYGDGSRGARLRAEYIYCNHTQECSAYHEGKCLNVTIPFNRRCELGRVEKVDGGTKQSKRYTLKSTHRLLHRYTHTRTANATLETASLTASSLNISSSSSRNFTVC